MPSFKHKLIYQSIGRVDDPNINLQLQEVRKSYLPISRDGEIIPALYINSGQPGCDIDSDFKNTSQHNSSDSSAQDSTSSESNDLTINGVESDSSQDAEPFSHNNFCFPL